MSLALNAKNWIDWKLGRCCIKSARQAQFSVAARSHRHQKMAPPSSIERISIGGQDYRSVREGLASILAPFRENDAQQAPGKKPRNNDEGEQAVFYNPIQQFNRDLSVLAILIYGEGAIIKKREKFQSKTSKAKKRKAQASKQTPAPTANGSGENQPVEEQPTKKRKIEEVVPENHDVDAKRLRVGGDDGGDDDLEVLELNGNTLVHVEPSESHINGGS